MENRGSKLAKRILDGDVRATAQALTLIADKDPRAGAVLKLLYPRTGRAHIIGVTGASGSGKSTLIGRMTAELRSRKKKVGILTVDPTNPFFRVAPFSATTLECAIIFLTRVFLSGV